MATRKSNSGRHDPKFADLMKGLMMDRYKKGLAKFTAKDLGLPEAERLLMRTKGFRLSIEELKTKPKKENLL